MSDDLGPLRAILDSVGGHLQDLRSEQSLTVSVLSQSVKVTEELQHNVGELQRNVGELRDAVQNLQARATSQEAALIALGGSFASIDQILSNLFADRVENQAILSGLRQDNQELN